jgi:dTDP-4-dehydrorhamnose 3,5-epimerase
MRFTKTPIEGAFLIDPDKKSDQRGWFARMWEEPVWRKMGLKAKITDVNLSINPKAGTLRGLHRQESPHEEAKVVTCIRGEIFDVFIDVRRQSPSFKRWFGVRLRAADHQLAYIPPGCAHGYLTLVDNCEALYLSSHAYSAESEQGIRYNDPAFSIIWPVPVKVISEKDNNWPDFKGGK